MTRSSKPCIVCNSKESTHMFSTCDRMFDIPGTFAVKKCKNCGLVFVDPQPSQTVLKKHYPSKKYYSYKGGEKRDIFTIVRSYLVRHYYNPTILSRIFSSLVQNVPAMPSKSEGKILDVGCGTGDTIVLLEELGWDVYGLEIDKKAIVVAKQKGLKNVKYGGYQDIHSYPDNYFDAIRLHHVIEHLPNPHLCSQMIYKKLKPGGEVIMGTPNYMSVTSKIFKKFWLNLDTPRHLFVFSPKTLSKIIQHAGFSHIRVDYCSAGGFIGSILNILGAVVGKVLKPEKYLWLILLLYPFVYPFEWLSDKFKVGDIIILRAMKKLSVIR